MNCKVIFVFGLFVVFTAVSVEAAVVRKGRAAEEPAEERPEEPPLRECPDEGQNRENCYFVDPPNYDNWRYYIQHIEDWEKKHPAAAEKFNAENPNKKKEEQETLETLKAFAALHE